MGQRTALKVYDFNLAAGGSQVLLVESEYFRIMSATGAVHVTGDTFGTLPDLLAGQGLQNTPYKRLVITDASGAPNSGTILCSGDLFIDNRTLGVVSISGQQGAFVQANATVTNASAQLLAANLSRRYLLVQNNDASGDIYVTLDSSAATVATGIKISAGGSLELATYCPSGAVFAIGSLASNANIVTVEG